MHVIKRYCDKKSISIALDLIEKIKYVPTASIVVFYCNVRNNVIGTEKRFNSEKSFSLNLKPRNLGMPCTQLCTLRTD